MTPKKRLIYQLFPSYLLITLAALVAMGWYALSFSRQFYLDRTETDLEVSGRLLEKQVIRLLAPLDQPAVDRLCKDAAGQSTIRVTIVLPDGQVVGDSERSPASMDNHRDRYEIREALQGRVGVSMRRSDTIAQNMMYVALPLYMDQTLVGVLRTALAITAIDRQISAIGWRIGVGALLVALLASVVSWVVSQRITKPLEKMRSGARQFADGDLAYRLALSDIHEFSGLAETMNQMAEQLQQRIDEINNQRSKTEAVLSSMREGVIATDTQQRVISINAPAARMLGVRPEAFQERNVLEIIRNHEFQELMRRSYASDESLESDIVYYQKGGCILNVRCTPLLDALQKRIGGLMVISDVTQLRRLENMRRDFAASVSHEIKTPLTAIKGFVETLCSGELEDREETRRFLAIIDKHANRLAAIIDDLMQLSRIEREDEIQQIGLEPCRIAEVLQAAIGLCRTALAAKGITVQLECDPSLSGRFDAMLLERAAVNLLDNAIKYSPENSAIQVTVLASADQIQIQFKDQGMGIGKKHLPRIFERFYRVDQARSRKLGGTGLGLAIVKHIAHAHGGSVTVESELGQGSTFTLQLPVT